MTRLNAKVVNTEELLVLIKILYLLRISLLNNINTKLKNTFNRGLEPMSVSKVMN